MSLKSREARRFAAASAAALVALGASAGSALADTSSTLNYTCEIPIVGPQPVTAAVTTNIPLTFPANTLTPAFNIDVQARAGGDTYLGLLTVGAAPGFISGKASTKARLIQPNGSTLNLTVPITIPKTATPADDPGAAGVLIPATGSTPRVQFIGAGTAQIIVDGISLNLLAQDSGSVNIGGLGATDDSDGNPDTFDVPCTGAAVKLADITVTGGPTPTPTPVPPTPTPTPVPPTPTPTPVPPTPTPTPVPPTPTPTPVPPTPTPTPVPPTPTPTPVPPTPTPTPVPPTPTPVPSGGSIVKYGYSIAGNAVLKGLTSGTIAVTGTGIYDLTLQTGAFTGKTTLGQSSAKLQAVRLLPITAQIAFTEVGPTTGTLVSRTLVANTKQSIQLKSAKVFGFNLVTSTCRTKTPSAITLKSGNGTFTPTVGGTISGTFAISDLTSCGVLNNLVSGLTKSSGNPISVKLTPKPVS